MKEITINNRISVNPAKSDLHMHTTYCDGLSSAEEMIRAAIDKGLTTVGISGHSYTPHNTTYCMSPEDTKAYLSELRMLRDKYADRIRVLIGTELDHYGVIDRSEYDYIIGSVHEFECDGEFIVVDYCAEYLKEAADKHFGGDMLALAERYYEFEGDIVRKTDCDIIGHFDLVTKFNEEEALIDTTDPRYVGAWRRAIDRIWQDWKEMKPAETGAPLFEINTGAIARGYRATPYPAQDICEFIKSRGGRFITNSDSHRAEHVGYMFSCRY